MPLVIVGVKGRDIDPRELQDQGLAANSDNYMLIRFWSVNAESLVGLP